VRQCPYSPLCMHRTYLLSRRQAYQHTQHMWFSSSGSGGRTRRPTSAVSCVGDSKTSRPARPPPIAGQLTVVGGVVTVSGRTWVAGAWLLQAVTFFFKYYKGSGGCAVVASAGTGSRLLRGWGSGEGEGVGVGPLILTPFLLEHSFVELLGLSRHDGPDEEGSSSPPRVGVGVGNF
jgi:hypothetical protein